MFEKSALKKAIQKNDTAKISALLARHPHLIDQPLPKVYGYSPLAYALEVGKDATVDVLLAAGAVVASQKACYMENILHHAARYGRLNYLKTWAAAHPALVHDRKNKWDYSIMHAAAYGKNPEVMVYLLGLGADPLAVAKTGETPLQLCEERGKTVEAALLKPYIDAAALRLAQAHAEAAKPPSATGWRKIDEYTVSYSREDAAAGYRLTDIFNFSLRTCVTLHQNLETKVETPVRHTLDELEGTPGLLSAQQELTRLGGSVPARPDYAVRKVV